MSKMKRPWFKKVADWCRKRGKFVVILDRDSKEPYLERFYIHPRWMTLGLFRVVIHRFWKSDTDEAFHDHPWLFWGSKLLEGEYIEHTPDGSFHRKPGKLRWNSGWALHQIELGKRKYDGKEKIVWTLFVMGPKIRDWGFKGISTNWKWIQWKNFLDERKAKKQFLEEFDQKIKVGLDQAARGELIDYKMFDKLMKAMKAKRSKNDA